MSKIGKMPVVILDGAKIEIAGKKVTVSGKNGKLELTLPSGIDVKKEEKELVLTRENDSKQNKSLHGLFRVLLHNMVVGVVNGFEETLELMGVGYRVSLTGKKLTLAVGFSHPVEINPPAGITFQVEGQNKVKVTGFDKQLVGQVAADIRAVRPVEPYKGKGIKYIGEKVRRKPGKAAKAGAGAGA